MTKKRDKLKIIHDILRVIQEKQGNARPTQILYKSNLSHQMMDEYLSELLKKGMIVMHDESGGRVYALTTRGIEYLQKYKVITEFIDSFGLNEDE